MPSRLSSPSWDMAVQSASTRPERCEEFGGALRRFRTSPSNNNNKTSCQSVKYVNIPDLRSALQLCCSFVCSAPSKLIEATRLVLHTMITAARGTLCELLHVNRCRSFTSRSATSARARGDRECGATASPPHRPPPLPPNSCGSPQQASAADGE